MYVGRRAVRASVLPALGMQGRDFDVIGAVRCGEVVPHMAAILVRGNDHGGDRRLRVVVDQPRLVLRHVVRRRKRLYVQRRIRRIRHVNVYEGRERFDLDAILWKRYRGYEQCEAVRREAKGDERETHR